MSTLLSWLPKKVQNMQLCKFDLKWSALLIRACRRGLEGFTWGVGKLFMIRE